MNAPEGCKEFLKAPDLPGDDGGSGAEAADAAARLWGGSGPSPIP